jgi:hypothetical protein
LFILVIIQYITSYYQENLEAVIQTNPFSNLRCIDDSQPIIRFIDSETVQCLSKDNQNCLFRKDFGIPDNIKCNDINTYLVKEIRNLTSKPRQVFDDLEKNTNYSLLTCNPDGMNNPNHWCGKIFNNILQQKCIDKNGKPTPEARFGYLKEPCIQIPIYAKSNILGKDVNITSSQEIIQAKEKQKQSVFQSRSRLF